MEPKKFEYIDSLRGIAILTVIVVHVSHISGIINYFPKSLVELIGRGEHSLQLFFIVSSYTIMMSYQNRINEKNAMKNFFIRRFFRIAPFFYIAILLMTLYFYFTKGVSVLGLVSSIFFVNGLFPEHINSYVPGGWSITIEFMFYFMMPFLAKKLTNVDNSLIFVLITLVVSIGLNTLLQETYFDQELFLYYYLPNQLPVFGLGIFTYWLINGKDQKIRNRTLFLLGAVIFLFSYTPLPRHILFSLIFVLLFIVLSKHPYKIFSNILFVKVGNVSYSMYLVHFGVLHALRHFDMYNIITVTGQTSAIINFVLMYMLVALCTYVISYITHKFIEIPGQNTGRKLIKKLNQQKIIS